MSISEVSFREEKSNKSEHEVQPLANLAPIAIGDQKLDRHLGFFSGTLMNVGYIIGTGIFSSPTFILGYCGSGAMMLVLWIVGAIFAGTGMWSYLELGTMLPKSGGTQEYLSYEFPYPKQLIAYLFMIMVGILSSGSGIASSAVAFGENIMYAIGGPDYRNEWQSRGFAIFCLTFWLVLNILSSRIAIRANNLFTVIKIVLLTLLICVGFAGLAGRLPNKPDIHENFSFAGTSNNPGAFASAVYYVIYSYDGWYNLNYVMDELKDPLKNLPRCAISALSITTALYILTNVAYLAVLPIQTIKDSNLTVAANLFNTAFGGTFGLRVLPVFVGLSSFGYVGVSFYSGSRIVLEAARKGFLPYDRFFSRVQPKSQTPINSGILLYLISLIFLLAPPPGSVFQFVTAFSGYGSYFFSALSVFGLLLLRRREPTLERPIKVPIIISVIFILICSYTLVFVFIPQESSGDYPYWLPYFISIILCFCSIGLWHYKVNIKKALETSYNAEITMRNQNDNHTTFSETTTSSIEEKV
ncbi:High-affinity methionine permease [Choanephora cucurbitarum]|uniref:High-affinity methionine permease n=1 Tax=Choanephora cucurbitarum TaxID=101091 RepID=A0A1C7N447_9FUNG|nr:High-affinity methionine permease [Choanephora cucurbitarum]